MKLASVKYMKRKSSRLSNEFIVKALDDGLTEDEADQKIDEALLAEVERLQLENEDMRLRIEEIEAEREKVEPAAKRRSGATPIARLGQACLSSSATDKWKREIQSKVSTGMDRTRAAKAVNREFPRLREQMLREKGLR